MKLTVLGSGTLVPLENRGSPALFLKIKDQNVLLDCGPGTLRQMVKAGFDYRDLDILILSHTHTDHTSDFAALLQALNYTPDFRRKKSLYIIGYRGISDFVDNIYTLYPDIRPLTYSIKVIKTPKYEFDGFKVETIKGNHSPSSIIVKITDDNGLNLVYTGDTRFDEKLGQFALKTDLLITECSHPENKLQGIHLTPITVGKLADLCKAKKILLVHFYPTVNISKVTQDIRKSYQGEVILAKDFLAVKI